MGSRKVVVGVLGVLGVAVIAAVAAGLVHRTGSSGAALAAPEVATTPIVRTDLVEQDQADGTLGYTGSYPVAGQGRQGVVTWLPAVGQTISRGQQVFGLDGHAVPLFYGGTPFYRTLRVGMDAGPDVAELNDNLIALGYRTGRAGDSTFSRTTETAVRRWQDSLGVAVTGVVAPGDVAVEPGEVRVVGVTAVLGNPPPPAVMTLTSTQRLVTVNLPVGQQQIAKQGAAVQVELPDGTRSPGHVGDVGTVAVLPPSTAPGSTVQSGPQNATITVRVTLDNPADAGDLDGAPVTVYFTSSVHNGVLAVPVTALLALASGGYAVEVVDPGGATRLVPVQLGAFAQGNVEITGNGLAEGMRVEVPSS
jgi:peptidoglycan hydrolase-like protein with peptidoglycan-binding domain